ncbi:cyclin-domain-containing protein [Thozetella sp. PMI_491]|nr:cyclin-domain-containing protein [Thozetella sp. PMI_491]
MLTRSPVPASPSTLNASPRSSFHAFHYAPGPSPRISSPARVPTALPGRQSSSGSLTSSPSLSRPKKHAYVDAATQYSPMEPVNYFASSAAAPALLPSSSSSEQHQSLEPPPIVGPQPMTLPDDPPPKAAQAAPAKSAARSLASKVPPPSATSKGPVQSTIETQPISPSKRRNSQGPGGSSTSLLAADQTPPKRSKQEMAAPKVLPLRYELASIEDVVALIAHMLGELIETNDPLALKSGHLTRFHSRTAPGISVQDYLNRLAKHATLTPPLLLAMVYYIDRLCALYPEFTINTLTVHRFLITAATVAAKGLSDSFWNNSTYARVGGVRVAELKLLELEFLYRVDWKIVPNPEVLVAYYRGLVERCPGYRLQGEGDSDEEDSSDILDDDDEDGSGEDQEFESGDERRPADQNGSGKDAAAGSSYRGTGTRLVQDLATRSGGNG